MYEFSKEADKYHKRLLDFRNIVVSRENANDFYFMEISSKKERISLFAVASVLFADVSPFPRTLTPSDSGLKIFIKAPRSSISTSCFAILRFIDCKLRV